MASSLQHIKTCGSKSKGFLHQFAKTNDIWQYLTIHDNRIYIVIRTHSNESIQLYGNKIMIGTTLS